MFIDLGGFFPIHVLNKRDPYIRIDDVGTGYEHVHIEYNGKKYSWYKDSHKTRHEGRDHGLNDVSKTMKKKLQELGVSDDYFQQILLEDFSRWQEGMSMKLPEKWQEGMSMKPPEKWQEGVDIPPEVAIGGLVVVVVIIAVALAFFTQGQSLWLLATV